MNAKAVAKQEEHVADALDRGAKLLTGGKRSDLGPLFFEPTVLVDVPGDALIFREETFGPVAAIAPFDTEEEAVKRANATEYGLVAYVHALDPRRIYRLSRALSFGMVAVNRTKVTGAPIPFGGMKQSGLAREGPVTGSRHSPTSSTFAETGRDGKAPQAMIAMCGPKPRAPARATWARRRAASADRECTLHQGGEHYGKHAPGTAGLDEV